jgi:hypothetical protein
LQDAALTRVQRSLALFGYPISEARIKVNSSGDRVLTQWFERARFEYHPTNPAASQVLLGRLGAELGTERAQMPQMRQSAEPWAQVSRTSGHQVGTGTSFQFVCSL